MECVAVPQRMHDMHSPEVAAKTNKPTNKNLAFGSTLSRYRKVLRQSKRADSQTLEPELVDYEVLSRKREWAYARHQWHEWETSVTGSWFTCERSAHCLYCDSVDLATHRLLDCPRLQAARIEAKLQGAPSWLPGASPGIRLSAEFITFPRPDFIADVQHLARAQHRHLLELHFGAALTGCQPFLAK
eukprot:5724717-Amphidinium_carterae.1